MTLDPMWIGLVILVVGFCVVVALTIGAIISSRNAQPESMKGRLEKLTKLQEELKNELPAQMGGVKPKKSLLSRIDLRPLLAKYTGEGYFQKMDLDLIQAGLGNVKVSEFIMIRSVVTFIGIAGFTLLSKNLMVGLVAGIPCWFSYYPLFYFLKQSRVTRFSNQLSAFLILIVNSLRAGQTFMQGADIASSESPDPIAAEFKQVIKEVNLGLPVEQSMDNMLVRVPSEDLKIVVAAYTIQRKVGGNLATILETTADTVRERIRIQGQINVLTTQGKLSGVVVGALPFAIGGIVTLLQPQLMMPFFADIVGKVLIGIALLLLTLGVIVIWNIVSIDI